MKFSFAEFVRRLRLLIFVLCAISVKSAVAAPVVATVLGVRGVSQVRHNGQMVALVPNGSLYPGDLIRVGSGAKVTVLFSDGSQNILKAGSFYQITAPTRGKGGNTSLFKLISGGLFAKMRPKTGGQGGDATLGVAGTEFELEVIGDQTVVTVTEGVVDFSNKFGAVQVGASQQSSATSTSAPTQPVTIAGAGFIVEWALDFENAVIPRDTFFVSLDPQTLATQLRLRTAKAAQNATDATSQRDLGDVLFDLKRPAQALLSYQKADALQPGQSAIATRLGYSLLDLARPDEAETAFRSAVETAPDATIRARALTGLSATQLSLARFAGAEISAREALTAAPQSAEATIALGLALFRQPGRETEAKTVFESALTAEPPSLRYQAQSWLALLQLSQNDLAGALQNATRAVQSALASGLAHGNLALVLFFENQPAQAVREAKIAARLNPQSVAARVALGQSLLARGDASGAARAAAQAVALDPQLSAAHYLLGIADAQQRDYVHAARSLRESLRLSPQFLPAVSALARVYNRSGHPQDALALLTSLQSAQRENGAVSAALGEVFYEQANYPQSLTQFERAVALQPSSALNYAGLSRVALDANRLSQAVSAGQKAVQLAPQIGQYHADLGLAYTFSRLDVQAERQYRAALSLDPQNALALVQLALLNQDGDARTTKRNAGLAFAQGFLYDPAVSRQFLRGGVENELRPRGGSRSDGFTYTLRDIGSEGNFHFYGRANRDSDDGNRDNSFGRELNARQDSTFTLGKSTNLYFHLFHRRDEGGLPGTTTNPFSDDRENFRFHQGILAARTRIGARGQLFAGFFANAQNDERTNPNRDDSSVLRDVLIFPIRVTNSGLHSAARDPEVRFDWQLGSDPAHPRLLSVGAAHLSTRNRLARDLLVPGLFGTPDNTGILRTQNDTQTNLFFAQLTQRTSEKLGFSLQLRAQRTKNRSDASFQNLSGGTLQAVSFPRPIFPDHTDFLPALNLNYQLNQRTALRFLASRRATDTTSSILTPAEAQLSAEGQVLPAGLPDRANLGEFDIERQLAGSGLLKLFGFRSSTRNLRFDASRFFSANAQNGLISDNSLLLGRVQRAGVGARYEKPIGRNLFGQTGLVLSRTRWARNGAVPYQPLYLATTGLNYVDKRGNKAAVTLNYAGAFYDAEASARGLRSRIAAKTTVDLLLSREPTVHQELFLQVVNVFNAQQVAFRDVPNGARRVQAGLSRRF